MTLTKKSIQAITIAAVLFVVLLIIALIINLVNLASARRTQRALSEMEAAMAAKIIQNEQTIELWSSPEFIELYAREYLGLMKPGEKAFS